MYLLKYYIYLKYQNTYFTALQKSYQIQNNVLLEYGMWMICCMILDIIHLFRFWPSLKENNGGSAVDIMFVHECSKNLLNYVPQIWFSNYHDIVLCNSEFVFTTI